MKEFI
jgi:hypothetical protein